MRAITIRRPASVLGLLMLLIGIRPMAADGGGPPVGEAVLTAMLGTWEGTARTWFQPGVLADESRVSGRFEAVLDGRFVRHVYAGSMRGRVRRGEELFAYNSITRRFESTWVDDFHMSDALMFAQGPGIPNGFEVFGHYDVGDGEPPWGWRTEYVLVDVDHLTITAYNLHPDGTEARAVETTYTRARPSTGDGNRE